MYVDRWFCGRSKLLVQIISWLQIIFNLTALIVGILFCVLYFEYEIPLWPPKTTHINFFHPDEYSAIETNRNYKVAMAVWLGLSIGKHLIGFIAGVILLLGVRQGDHKKLCVWLFVIPVILLLTLINVAYMLLATGENHSVPRMINFVFNYLCIWPIVVHRKELKDLDRSQSDSKGKEKIAGKNNFAFS